VSPLTKPHIALLRTGNNEYYDNVSHIYYLWQDAKNHQQEYYQHNCATVQTANHIPLSDIQILKHQFHRGLKYSQLLYFFSITRILTNTDTLSMLYKGRS